MTRSLRIFLVVASISLLAAGCNDSAAEPNVTADPTSPASEPNAEPVSASQEADPLLDSPKEFTNSIGMKLKRIPAGEFVMGSFELESNRHNDEGPLHDVRISKAFYMGIHEVTQAQWKSVMGTEPWSGKGSTVKAGANYPATYVSWEDAVAFCKKLSASEGRTYRLPTEGQWEYACRAGTATAFSISNGSSIFGDYAWYGGIEGNGNCQNEKYAHEVGRKRPNPWGLYDMHGNVFEWCQDWYAFDSYGDLPVSDPSGPATGSLRVLRGGGWCFDPGFCRSALRGRHSPDSSNDDLGFRVVLELEKE